MSDLSWKAERRTELAEAELRRAQEKAEQEFRRLREKAEAYSMAYPYPISRWSLTLALTLIGLLIAAFFAFGPITNGAVAKYQAGSIVSMKLDGQKGTVIGSVCTRSRCIYAVRFPLASGGYSTLEVTEAEISR